MVDLININRLTVCLDTSARPESEDETQHLAGQMMELERRSNASNPQASFFSIFKIIVAKATLSIKKEWLQVMGTSINDRARMFEHWVKLERW